MKKLFLGTVALIALAGSASAADLPVKARPVVAVPACAQFGGFYLGAYAGAAYYDHTWSDRDAWTSFNTDDIQRSNVRSSDSGFIGGVQGGYNLQFGCTVFGVQADYGWASVSASTFDTDGDLGVNQDSLSVESRLKGLGTVRLRSGIVVDNLMLYVTGGIGFGRFDRTYSQVDLNGPNVETFSSNKSKWAWVTGVGTEWAFWGSWSIQSEVLYAKFEKDTENFTCTIFCNNIPVRFDHEDSAWIAKIGVNYRFGGAPVVARY